MVRFPGPFKLYIVSLLLRRFKSCFAQALSCGDGLRFLLRNTASIIANVVHCN